MKSTGAYGIERLGNIFKTPTQDAKAGFSEAPTLPPAPD